MMDRPEDIVRLNGYVDGELSPSEAAEVARLAALRPEVAARIAFLREMKAAFADLAPTPPAALVIPRQSGPARWQVGRKAAIAAIVTLASLVLLVAVLKGGLAPERGPDWPSVIEAHHRSWAFSHGVAEPESIRSSELATGLMSLDLADARLDYVGSEHIAYRDITLYRAGYEGTRGCRLSMFVLPHSLGLSDAGFGPPLRVHMWSQGDYDLLVIADSMAEERFNELALAIERAVREQRPFDADTRQRLAQMREISRPCRA
jgi:anti-sigma factor RsiW